MTLAALLVMIAVGLGSALTSWALWTMLRHNAQYRRQHQRTHCHDRSPRIRRPPAVTDGNAAAQGVLTRAGKAFRGVPDC